MTQLSRQRLWQIKMQQTGRCATCGKKAVNSTYCAFHRDYHNKRNKLRMRRDYLKHRAYYQAWYKTHKKAAATMLPISDPVASLTEKE